MMRGVEKHRALLSLGQTAAVIDDDLQTMSRLYSCNARRKARSREGQETPSSAVSKPKSLPIRQSPNSPTPTGSSSVGRGPPSRPELPSHGEAAGKRPAPASPSPDPAVPHCATRPKIAPRMPLRFFVKWLNPKPDAVDVACEQDISSVVKTFDELVGWIRNRFRLEHFGCKVNLSELRCVTLPPPEGADELFETVSFKHAVLTASQYDMVIIIADLRGQLWLTFETVDDATRHSSPATPGSVDGLGSSSSGPGGDPECDVIYVKTTTKSSLPVTAPATKREGSASLPPEVLVPAPAANEDDQLEKGLEEEYESDEDLQAPLFKQQPRSRAADDEPDSESESGYAIDDGELLLEHVADLDKLALGESDNRQNTESQALAADKDDTDYNWYVL